MIMCGTDVISKKRFGTLIGRDGGIKYRGNDTTQVIDCDDSHPRHQASAALIHPGDNTLHIYLMHFCYDHSNGYGSRSRDLTGGTSSAIVSLTFVHNEIKHAYTTLNSSRQNGSVKHAPLIVDNTHLEVRKKAKHPVREPKASKSNNQWNEAKITPSIV